ncbi:hypothetical protein LX73_2162 [Fodinibius salinus]|uniref:Uncharacterized protein n=1 Tax=Fodinibius salinus TaxID=860790 RepID=A0A5D3YJ78_9BACT|nr:hypothetical protein [Fodinibius salinus]TYP92795.1 hypothetical protein LX73_2162 [Fodinibius salinus]
MAAKFQKLKDELKSLEEGELISRSMMQGRQSRGLFFSGLSAPKWLKNALFVGFLSSFLLYSGFTLVGSIPSVNTSFDDVQSWVNEPDEDLLQGMGSWMEEMGYTDLSRQELIDLREQGVTATFISRMHDLGYTDLTLDQVVQLSQNDVSSTFTAMMKELGYTLTVDELVELRQHGVTAYYTSNLHDLGYTDVTKEELIRLKDTGVEIDEVQRLIEQREEELPAIEELIRYHISNQ